MNSKINVKTVGAKTSLKTSSLTKLVDLNFITINIRKNMPSYPEEYQK